jgi:hypothetical protein
LFILKKGISLQIRLIWRRVTGGKSPNLKINKYIDLRDGEKNDVTLQFSINDKI